MQYHQDNANPDNGDDHAAAVGPKPPAADEIDEYDTLPIDVLLPADSPRLEGENPQHARLIAESGAELPPVLVHRRTLRLIDGMHRLHAARLRGDEKIRLRYFDGSDDAAFIAAVEANIAHGLPLTLADREAAAVRILAAHPQWSDRTVAVVVGLSPKTVGAVRSRSTAGIPQLHSRLGRDGRLRPVNGADGRRRASELFAQRPDASLREVAKQVGISPGTARDVRERLRRGEDPIPPRQRAEGERAAALTPERRLRREVASTRVSCSRDRATIIRNLRRDPSIRFTNAGRNLLRWLDAHAIGADNWEAALEDVPPHCRYVLVDLACAIAEEWLCVAERLRQSPEAAA